MITAKVTTLNIQERIFNLEPGTHRLGSDLDCDIVLSDKSVLPHHITLYVSNSSVEVEVADGADAEFHHFISNTVSYLRVEEKIRWFAGDSLQMGEVYIELQGIEREQISDPPIKEVNENKFKKWLSKKVLWISCITFAAIAIVALFFWGLRSWGSLTDVPIVDEKMKEPPKSTQVESLTELQSIQNKLVSLGIKPESVTRKANRLYAIFRVSTDAERQNIMSKLDGLDAILDSDIYVDDQIWKAIELVFVNTNSQVKITKVEKGIVTLSAALVDKKAIEPLRRTLLNDIPGIAQIRFVDTSATDVRQIRSLISAIWLGEFPYIVLTDNTILRPGDKIGANGKLIEVGQEHIIIEFDGKREKVSIQ